MAESGSFPFTANWRDAFEAVKCEPDQRKLPPLIAAAEDAILMRWQELSNDDASEREELADAAAELWHCRREVGSSRGTSWRAIEKFEEAS
jgi:hypothetical protein